MVAPVILDQEQVDLVGKALNQGHQLCDSFVTELPEDKVEKCLVKYEMQEKQSAM